MKNTRIAKYVSKDIKCMSFKSFIISQFNYCPIICMCHRRGSNNKINNIHERPLRIVYRDKKFSFETLLKRDKSTSIHMENLQYLATESFKVKNGLFPEIMIEIFVFQKNGKSKIVLSSPFSKIKLENGPLINVHASFSRHV